MHPRTHSRFSLHGARRIREEMFVQPSPIGEVRQFLAGSIGVLSMACGWHWACIPRGPRNQNMPGSALSSPPFMIRARLPGGNKMLKIHRLAKGEVVFTLSGRL